MVSLNAVGSCVIGNISRVVSGSGVVCTPVVVGILVVVSCDVSEGVVVSSVVGSVVPLNVDGPGVLCRISLVVVWILVVFRMFVVGTLLVVTSVGVCG